MQVTVSSMHVHDLVDSACQVPQFESRCRSTCCTVGAWSGGWRVRGARCFNGFAPVWAGPRTKKVLRIRPVAVKPSNLRSKPLTTRVASSEDNGCSTKPTLARRGNPNAASLGHRVRSSSAQQMPPRTTCQQTARCPSTSSEPAFK